MVTALDGMVWRFTAKVATSVEPSVVTHSRGSTRNPATSSSRFVTAGEAGTTARYSAALLGSTMTTIEPVASPSITGSGSSTPMTKTGWGTNQLVPSKSSDRDDAGPLVSVATCHSRGSEVLKSTRTGAVGAVLRTTKKSSESPASEVTSPAVGVTVIPAVSLS